MKVKLQLIIALTFLSLHSYSQIQIGSDILGEAAMDNCGNSVSISADGNILAIGATGNNRTNPLLGGQGHVRVFENVDGNWEQLGQDIDGEGEGDQFGVCVSLSSDGTRLAIGAAYNDGFLGDLAHVGHVRIYEYNFGYWIMIVEIDGLVLGEGSGASVALSGDGTTVAIGAPWNGEMALNAGIVRIYEEDTGLWFQVGGSIYGEAESEYVGGSVSISDDGSIIAIGSSPVRVFEYNESTSGWAPLGSYVEGESGFVSLSSDGHTLAIGNAGNVDNGPYAGQVRVYAYSVGSWSQVGANINGEAGDFFGSSVSLSSNGNILGVGASSTDGPGKAQLYEYDDDTWNQIGADMIGDAIFDRLGKSVSVSADGNIIVIGADGNDANGDFSGHVKVFGFNEVLSIANPEISLATLIYPNPVSNRFRVELDAYSVQSIEIYNALGKKVMTSAETSVDISHLTKGLYHIEVKTSRGIVAKKIIKN